MTNLEWKYESAEDMAAALTSGKISARELTDAAIARIESLEPTLNAVCVRDFDRARDAARAADDALAAGEQRPLLGVPLLVKESFHVAGLPTTWGFPKHRNFIAMEDFGLRLPWRAKRWRWDTLCNLGKCTRMMSRQLPAGKRLPMCWDGCATLPRRPDGGIWVWRLKRPVLRLSRKRWHEREGGESPAGDGDDHTRT